LPPDDIELEFPAVMEATVPSLPLGVEAAGAPEEAEAPGGGGAAETSADAEGSAGASWSGPDWKREEAISAPEVAGLSIIAPLIGEPGAPPSAEISLPSKDMLAALDLKGFPEDIEESSEEPVIRGREIQRPSIITATVPPMTYWVDLFFLVWNFIITPPV